MQNNANDLTIEKRRELVAQLRLRHYSQREIAAALEKAGFLNPRTKKPYTHATVASDIDALMEDWRAAAGVDTQLHAAHQLAELTEIKREAWKAKDLRTLLRALELEGKLVGTLKPLSININVPLVLVEQTVHAIEAIGANATEVFEQIIAEAAAITAAQTTALPVEPPPDRWGSAA
jgi:hypothetical protein